MNTHDLFEQPCTGFIGAIGHHAFFTENAAAQERIARFCTDIRTDGLAAFLTREYPAGRDKAVIVNLIGDGENATPCLVDGNAHLLAVTLCHPPVTLGDIVRAAGRPGVVRAWRNGWEDGSGQDGPYDTYIPVDTDVSHIPAAHDGTNWFVQPPCAIKVIPSSIRFDSPLFALRDRGRTLAETGRALRELPGFSA